MLDGYQTKYWNGTEYEYTEHDPEPRAFALVISQWPTCIDDNFVDKLYNYEDSDTSTYQIEIVIADALLENEPRLNVKTSVGLKVRDLWYESWYFENNDRLSEYIWLDLYKAIGKNEWLFERLLFETRLSMSDTLLIGVFNNRLDEMVKRLSVGWYGLRNVDFEFVYSWIYLLDDHVNGDRELPDSITKKMDYDYKLYTPFGEMWLIDYIGLMTEDTDFLEEAEGLLRRSGMSDTDWVEIPGNWGFKPVPVSPANQLIRSTDPKADLEAYFNDEEPWTRPTYISKWSLLHHPWFKKLRAADDFEEWWNEWNHDTPYTEADPYFGVPHG